MSTQEIRERREAARKMMQEAYREADFAKYYEASGRYKEADEIINRDNSVYAEYQKKRRKKARKE